MTVPIPDSVVNAAGLAYVLRSVEGPPAPPNGFNILAMEAALQAAAKEWKLHIEKSDWHKHIAGIPVYQRIISEWYPVNG